LSAHFGEGGVFMDVVAIEPGEDFVEAIQRSVGSVHALLAVIGRSWLTSLEPRSGNRRLDDPLDYVRLEIKTALERKIRVIPVLVAGASMPAAAEVPEDLAALPQRNALELNDLHWKDGVERLMNTLERVLDEDARPEAQAGGGTGATERERELTAAADRCLEHLSKIRLARDRNDPAMLDNEIWYLGEDVEQYAEATRSVRDSRLRELHRALVDQIHPIVAHDLAGLDRLIEDLVAATS
jgi:hypothetical protein